MMQYDEILKERYEIALRNVNERAWNKMDLSEKREAFQDIENYRAFCEDREAAKIEISSLNQDSDSSYRYFGDQNGSTITFDKDLNHEEMMVTYNHEVSHFRDYLAQVDPGFAERANYRDIDVKHLNASWQYDYESDPSEIKARYQEEINTPQMHKQQEILKTFDQEHHEQISQIVYRPNGDVLTEKQVELANENPQFFEGVYNPEILESKNALEENANIQDISQEDYSQVLDGYEMEAVPEVADYSNVLDGYGQSYESENNLGEEANYSQEQDYDFEESITYDSYDEQ